MKTMYRILVLLGLFAIGVSCSDESLSPEYEYNGPIPAIAEGPSEAQKICYELYQKYDHHVYYTLSGDEALRTNVWKIQVNNFWYLPEDTFPLEAADDATSEVFLRLLRAFYGALPVETVKATVIKRQVLVKANLWEDVLSDYGFWVPEFYSIAYTREAQQGAVYWGEMDDEIGPQPDVWKYSICLSFFTTRVMSHFVSDVPLPTEFAQVSRGLYFGELSDEEQFDAMMEMVDMDTGEINMDFLMERGFIHPYPYLMATSEYYQYEDIGSFATWVACHPLTERQESLDAYPLVKKKYELTLEFYKKYLKIDLEEFCKFWTNVTVE
jgi:lipoprotein